MEGLPPARYPVSKTGGLHGLGGSTPSPSALFWIARPRWRAARPRKEHAGTRARRHGRVGKAARCYRAGGERRSQVRVLLPPLHDATSSNGQDDRLLPGECWFDPSRRSRVGEPLVPHRPPPHADRMDPPCRASRPAKPASGRHGSRIERSLCLTRFTPRSSSGSRMPASQAGDAGSNPARGLEVGEPGVPPPSALGRVWRRGLAVSRVRRVRFPSRALLAVAQWTSTTLLPWPTGVRLLPARLRRKASSEPSGRDPDEQGAIPWRRLVCSRAGSAERIPAARIPACGGADP